MANDSQRLIQETVLSLLLEKGAMFSDKDDMRTFNQKVYEKIRWVKPPNYIRTHVSNAQKRIKVYFLYYVFKYFLRKTSHSTGSRKAPAIWSSFEKRLPSSRAELPR